MESALASIIPRHPFPTGNAEAGLAVLQENAQQLIDGLEEGSTNPGDALSTTLTLAEAHCLMDPRAAIFPTWDAWVDAMQIGSALFACRVPQPPPSEVELRVEHRMRRRVIIERPSPVRTTCWCTKRPCVSGSVAGPPHGLSSRVSWSCRRRTTSPCG